MRTEPENAASVALHVNRLIVAFLIHFASAFSLHRHVDRHNFGIFHHYEKIPNSCETENRGRHKKSCTYILKNAADTKSKTFVESCHVALQYLLTRPNFFYMVWVFLNFSMQHQNHDACTCTVKPDEMKTCYHLNALLYSLYCGDKCALENIPLSTLPCKNASQIK